MELPFWQLDSIYPGLDSQEFEQAIAESKNKQDLLFKNLNKSSKNTSLESFEDTLTLVNDGLALITNINAYLSSEIAVDAFNKQAVTIRSSLSKLMAKVMTNSKLFTKLISEIDLESFIESSEYLKAHSFSLQKGLIFAEHLLSPKAEEIVSKLSGVGGEAWAKLYNELVAKTTIPALLEGEEKDYNLAQLKQLQTFAERNTRKSAFEAEIELLEKNSYSFAACLNGIKGQVNTLAIDRKWESALDEAANSNNLSRKAIAAMQQACEEAFVDFRAYFAAKAKLLGQDKLAWYDLFAPITKEERRYDWQEAQDFVLSNFSSFSSELADFAKNAFANNWLDAPARQGKRNGAFCVGFPIAKESRIMLNYSGTLDSLFTLAHELGHAYHNFQKYKHGLSSLQQQTPMALAETASIFSETIVINALLKDATKAQKLAILEQDLVGAAQLIVDIHSRFLFEDEVFKRRLERELSVEELKAIMLDAQDKTYGEALSQKHPYMWAHKGHYYSSGRSYYNYPYSFGYLFALGLYSKYQEKPNGFLEKYNNLLASTGLANAAELAKQFDIDIEDTDFWRKSLEIPKTRIAEYIKLVG